MLRVGLVALACAAGCSQSKGDSEGAEREAPTDVLFDGEATDEALLRMLDASPKEVATRRLSIDAPPSDTALPSSTPPEFVYRISGSSVSLPPSARPPRSPGRRMLDELEALLGPERVAFAHGAPLNGPGFLLILKDQAGAQKLRAFTNRTSYTPPGAVWQALAKSGERLTLEITWAIFDQNDIPSDGGPFIGASAAYPIQ